MRGRLPGPAHGEAIATILLHGGGVLMHDHTAKALDRINESLHALFGSGSARGVTKQDLNEMEARIMTAISDYAAKVQESFDKISAGIDGVQSDVTELKAEIAALQGSSTISPDDQAALDSIAAKATALADRIQALDDQTAPPPAPTT